MISYFRIDWLNIESLPRGLKDKKQGKKRRNDIYIIHFKVYVLWINNSGYVDAWRFLHTKN